MPSSSTLSDVNSARVRAREEHYILHRSSAPVAKYRNDSADLGGVGAHATLPSQLSYPETVDITDEESTSSTSPATAAPSITSLHQKSSLNGDSPRDINPTRTYISATAGDPFLPPFEFRNWMRQRSSERTERRRSSQASDASPTRSQASHQAIKYRTRRGEIPEHDHQEQIAFSVSHTAPPGSVQNGQGDYQRVEYEPSSEDPWSPERPVTIYLTDQVQSSDFTLFRGQRELFRTPMS